MIINSTTFPWLLQIYGKVTLGNRHVISKTFLNSCLINGSRPMTTIINLTVRPNNFHSKGCFNLIDLPVANLFYINKRYAGHSKWQNIKHVKAANDAAKSLRFNYLVNQLRLAIRDNAGNSNPITNDKLAEAIEIAKANQVPRTTIEKVLKRWEATNEDLATHIFGIKGPSGTFILLECLTARPKDIQLKLNSLLKKVAMTSCDLNSANSAFNRRGVIRIVNSKPFPLGADEKDIQKFISFEKAEELAIELGAEDITENVVEVESMDNIGNNAKADPSNDQQSQIHQLEFICDIPDFHRIKTELTRTHHCSIRAADIEYLPDPNRLVKLENRLDRGLILKLFETLEENMADSISKIYSNIDNESLSNPEGLAVPEINIQHLQSLASSNLKYF